MITSTAGVSGLEHKEALTDDELAAVAGGIIIVPHSPPMQPPRHIGSGNDPVTPPGGYTP